MSQNPENVVDHLQSHAGDALRAVVIYDGETHRDTYRRDDTADRHGSESELLAEVRAERRRGSEPAGWADDQLRATVRVFDGRVVMHFPRDDETGTVVVLDPTVAQQLTEFVADVRRDLYGG